MNVEVKLYHYHDLDLVKIYQSGTISFSAATKLALRAYAKKEYFRFELSEPKEAKPISRSYRFRISLDEKNDADIIELLQKIHLGNRNNFIKTILRSYICCAIPSDYFDEKDKQYFQERYEEMFSNRKKVPCAMKRFSSNTNRLKSRKTQGKATSSQPDTGLQKGSQFASNAKLPNTLLKPPAASGNNIASDAKQENSKDVSKAGINRKSEFASDAKLVSSGQEQNESDADITNMFINIIN